jgi:hypothetical protein
LKFLLSLKNSFNILLCPAERDGIKRLALCRLVLPDGGRIVAVLDEVEQCGVAAASAAAWMAVIPFSKSSPFQKVVVAVGCL